MSDTKILVIDDEESIRHMLSLLLGSEGWSVEAVGTGEEGLIRLVENDYDLVLCDVRMPGLGGIELLEELGRRGLHPTVIVMSAFGSREMAIQALKAGAYDYVDKPFQRDEILLTVVKALERQKLHRENRALKREIARRTGLHRLIGHSDPMQEVYSLVQRVAPFTTTVLISGESGTGKELVARALHDLSPRADRPFIPVNCGAIPGQLLESELFGHVKGAFTDASRDKDGLFLAAHKGTLFLDEIAELPLELQVKLLRVLQEQEVRRLGESVSRPVDVRILAATHQDLDDRVAKGLFRQDLLYRLKVINIPLPPLRERVDDLPALVEHFVTLQNQRQGTAVEGLSPAAMKAIQKYHWPGNVRELQNALERGSVLCQGPLIDLEDLPPRLHHSDDPLTTLAQGDELSIKILSSRLEKILITRALEKTEGNRTQAAKLLEISHRALLYKVKNYDIDL